MKIMLVSGRRLAYFMARTFLSKGYEVVVINRNAEECSWLARRLKAVIIHGDASDPKTLEDAGADTTDVILVASPLDADNLVICQLAEIRFNIPRRLALVNDPDNEEVFRQLGITNTFSITKVLSSLIEQRVDSLGITNLIPIDEGKVNVTELVLGAGAPVVGQPLSKIALPEGSLIACVLRGHDVIVPRGTTELAERDRLVVVTTPNNHGEVLNTLTGEES